MLLVLIRVIEVLPKSTAAHVSIEIKDRKCMLGACMHIFLGLNGLKELSSLLIGFSTFPGVDNILTRRLTLLH